MGCVAEVNIERGILLFGVTNISPHLKKDEVNLMLEFVRCAGNTSLRRLKKLKIGKVSGYLT